MKTELLGQEKNVVRVKVEFEAAEFSKGLAEALGEISRSTNIPGFRKGHAPRRVIEMRIGRQTLYNEALEKILPGALQQVVEDYDLETISDPSIHVDDIHEGEPVTCELTLEVMPETELPALEEIEVERLNSKVTDDMVNALILDIRKRHSHLESVERPAGKEDVVAVNFVTRVLDDASSGEGDPQKGEIDLSDEDIRDEVRSALLGRAAGETVETEFDVEPDYRDSTVAGKRVHYTMTLETVNARILPDLDAAFFKTLFGEDTEVATEEAFRRKIGDDLLARMKRENEAHAADRAVDEVARRSKVEVPESLVERQAELLKKRDDEDARRHFNIGMKELLSVRNEDEARYEGIIRSRAVEMVRNMLVLDAIGKKYDVEVSKDDFEAEVDRRTAIYGIDRNRLLGLFHKDRKFMAGVVDDLRYSKITALLMTLVKVRDVDELSAPQVEAASADKTGER
ncbi:trigger factor [uncultured Fretibacterium sp.]|uniref:trigger factor n=1 Tax=uncultured Fretibacterium sp. TaxID=1678694 RepID=UPI002625F63D|nr:trigger factor [uncultured Fretibacterium sp.]